VVNAHRHARQVEPALVLAVNEQRFDGAIVPLAAGRRQKVFYDLLPAERLHGMRDSSAAVPSQTHACRY
jgi:hypothetical protein